MSFDHSLLERYSANFTKSTAILRNNDRVPCFECRGCSLRLINPTVARIKKHREVCPSRLKFKYVYPKNPAERLAICCTVCSEVIRVIGPTVLSSHRQNCTSEPETQIHFRSVDELLSTCSQANVQSLEPNQYQISTQMEISNVVEVADSSNEAASTMETTSIHPKSNNSVKTRTWDIRYLKFDFRILRLRGVDGTLKRCMQCLICSRVIRRVGIAQVKSHRNVCSRDRVNNVPASADNSMVIRETLVTTTTTPHDRDYDESEETNFDDVQEIKQCFICDAAVEIHADSDKNHFGLFSTNTSHSNTPIYDLVWKFLGGQTSQRNLTTADVDSLWNCVCRSCFQNIEDYDFVSTETQRLENVLSEKLSITEKMYEKHNGGDEDSDIIEADYPMIISDDEFDQIEGSSQTPQGTVQTQQIVIEGPQTVVQTPQTVVIQAPQDQTHHQIGKEAEYVIELNSDDGESEKGSEFEVEQSIPEPIGFPDERVLTFDEL